MCGVRSSEMYIPDETAVQTLATISHVQLVDGRFKRINDISDDGVYLLDCWYCHFVSHAGQFQTGGYLIQVVSRWSVAQDQLPEQVSGC